MKSANAACGIEAGCRSGRLQVDHHAAGDEGLHQITRDDQIADP